MERPFDRHPAAIARCSDVSDVQAALGIARRHNLTVAVRSGGHDYAGHSVCDGGLVIDLSQMNDIAVDGAARTVRAGPGARWGAVDRQTQSLGLATTGGSVSSVGVAGYTLGGGSGHLSRKYGLALDTLLSADVLTADGKLVRASEREHEDLFWALRGGSGNFGVVTSLELRLHEHVTLQQTFDAGMPPGHRWYSKAHYFCELTDGAIATLLRHVEDQPGDFTMVYLEAEGGAVGRVPPDATAFPHRDASFALHIFPGWAQEANDAAMIEWARALHRDSSSHATGGAYVNLLGGDEQDGAQSAYGSNYDRLAELKRKYDPDNVFRMNRNVRP